MICYNIFRGKSATFRSGGYTVIGFFVVDALSNIGGGYRRIVWHYQDSSNGEGLYNGQFENEKEE